MAGSTLEKLTQAHQNNTDAIFSLFTLAGHVVSGRITAIGETITLEAGKEIAEVPVDRVEAFCYRKL
jgi:riboflavin synthase alpha subunit